MIKKNLEKTYVGKIRKYMNQMPIGTKWINIKWHIKHLIMFLIKMFLLILNELVKALGK